MNAPSHLPQSIFEDLVRHAELAYPSECCGMVFGSRQAEASVTRVRRCRNAQDEFHARDPDNFPRDSRTAYFIDPRELLAIERELSEARERIVMVYHSHIDTDAYFSEEDRLRATFENEPVLPGVDYLVFSVNNKQVTAWKIFRWNDRSGSFEEVADAAGEP